MRRLWASPFRFLLLLPLAFAIGWLLPDWAFLVVALILLPVGLFEMLRISERKGYWRAYMEVTQVMRDATEEPGRSDSEVLNDIVGKITVLVMTRAGKF